MVPDQQTQGIYKLKLSIWKENSLLIKYRGSIYAPKYLYSREMQTQQHQGI